MAEDFWEAVAVIQVREDGGLGQAGGSGGGEKEFCSEYPHSFKYCLFTVDSKLENEPLSESQTCTYHTLFNNLFGCLTDFPSLVCSQLND